MRLIKVLASVTLLSLLLVSCNNEEANKKPQKEREVRKEATLSITKVGRKGDLVIEKATLEGHEYWLFYGRLATAPGVVHSESCQCKNK